MFFIGWVFAGIAMSMALYEAAFSTLKEFTSDKFRRSITLVTLFGALASTAFWPISFYANQWLGWKAVFLIFAGLHFFICLPLHWWFIPRVSKHEPVDKPSVTSALNKHQRRKSLLMAIAFAAQSFIATAITAHIAHIAGFNHISDELTIFAVSLIGPMQLIGRIIEFIYSRNIRLLYLGLSMLIIQTLCLFLLFLLGPFSWVLILFAMSFGVANGLMTIVRAMAPAEWFAETNYAQVLARLSASALFMRACAPALVAVSMDLWGMSIAIALLIFIAVLSLICFYTSAAK
jgi:predicted MFS family arabinose efflux permease